MRYSARTTAQTSGKEKITADDNGITIDIKDGNAPRMRVTVRDTGKGEVYYSCYDFMAGRWILKHEIMTINNK